MRRAAAVIVLLLTLAAMPVQAASAAPGGEVTTVISTQPVVQTAVGATLSLIQLCPSNAVLARNATRAAVTPTPAGFRLLSRELWPAGMVTRWRLVGDGFGPRTPRATMVCRAPVDADATRYVGSARVILRLWGPTPRKAWTEAHSRTTVLLDGIRLDSRVQVPWITASRMVAVAEVYGQREVFAYGGIAGPYKAGTYGGFRVAVRISAQLP